MISTRPLETSPEWDSNDVSALRDFLASPAGRKIFPVLVEEGPSLGGLEPQRVALQAKLVEGYELCLRAFARLTQGMEKNTVDEVPAYPSLTDDKYWTGPKLNQEEEED